MANADALRARATYLYDLSEKVDNWGERLRLRYRAKMLECEAETAVGDDVPEAHVIAATTSGETA